MLLPPSIECPDGMYYPWDPQITAKLARFGELLEEKHKRVFSTIRWGFYFDYTGFGGVVRRSTDRALRFWEHNYESEPCGTCQGRGYIVGEKVDVVNGRPYKIKKTEWSFKKRYENVDWENPLWCPTCDGHCSISDS